jgi:hypothetical protein
MIQAWVRCRLGWRPLSIQESDVRSWPIAARTCATARPQLAKANTAFQGASVGQPTELCLQSCAATNGLPSRIIGGSGRAAPKEEVRGFEIPQRGSRLCYFFCSEAGEGTEQSNVAWSSSS